MNMTKSMLLFAIIVVVIGTGIGISQIWIVYDCLYDKGKKLEFLNCVENTNDLSDTHNKSKLLIQTESSDILVYVEIADDIQEQIDGLMFRGSLEWDSGMIFVYNNEETRSFWMKNTLIPLDMLFVDEDFRIVDIKENVPPCNEDPCPSYQSNQPVKYVLEVNGGFVQANHIKAGDLISFDFPS